MARIAGVNIPTNKQVGISLTYIFGIGRTKALEILTTASVPADRRVSELSDADIAKLAGENILRVMAAAEKTAAAMKDEPEGSAIPPADPA